MGICHACWWEELVGADVGVWLPGIQPRFLRMISVPGVSVGGVGHIPKSHPSPEPDRAAVCPSWLEKQGAWLGEV